MSQLEGGSADYDQIGRMAYTLDQRTNGQRSQVKRSPEEAQQRRQPPNQAQVEGGEAGSREAVPNQQAQQVQNQLPT